MTAHVVYTAIDPLAPATTSVTVVRDVIRDWIGFSGLLMSDDISMGALSGALERRSRAALAAGCELILHCDGKLEEMEEVASTVPALEGEAAVRAKSALARRRASERHDTVALRVEWTKLVDAVTHARGASL